MKIHCSKECKTLLDRLGGYQFTERGLVAMKGKTDQLTYWLIGEDASRGARRQPIHPPQPRSSLKNKHLAKSPLFRYLNIINILSHFEENFNAFLS